MKDTVVIAFNGGAYGTYLEWCLTTLVNGQKVQDPLTNVGNSHIFKGNHLLNINGWQEYLASDCYHQFVRLHPKVKQEDSLSDNLYKIANDAQSIVYLYPDKDRLLLVVNNFFYKVWESWISHSFTTEISPDKIYKNWPVNLETPLEDIPRWIIREFLSFYLMPAWLDQIEWNHSLSWKHPKSITVTVSELLFDFKETLLKVEKFCNLTYKQPIENLFPIHEKNLQLQKYVDHDRLCHLVIESVVSGSNLDWKPLSLPSEAWIQWELRNQGFEIRCDGLDTFPTNSLQLRELLYPI